ncbi:MAG: hypothetical protein KAT43_06155 [Nanoarchaeota archaeon]|nr:hypothetical protein [Nanoarchaeota archaeon]
MENRNGRIRINWIGILMIGVTVLVVVIVIGFPSCCDFSEPRSREVSNGVSSEVILGVVAMLSITVVAVAKLLVKRNR